VDFRNTVIIMTSNLGGQDILDHAATGWEAAERLVLAALRQAFKPEFLNRVDDIVVFRPLEMAQIEHIVDLQLQRLERLLTGRKLTLEVTAEAKRALASNGFDPIYGARPLKRAIQRYVQNPLALSVLEGSFSEGDHVIVSTGPDGELSFSKKSETQVFAGQRDLESWTPLPERALMVPKDD